ncbi:MAG: MCP four helix bundle domain-containing protein [Xanthobacteraceae bacterium]
MSFLSRFRILTKILAVIGILSLAAAGITALGIASLKQIAEQTGLVSRTSDEALLVARINTNLQAVSANIYRLAGDPRPEARSAAEADIKDELDSFKKRLTALNELVVSADSKARLAKVSSDMDALNGALKSIDQAADGVQNFQMTQEMQQVRDAAGSASKLVGTLRNALRGMMEIYGKRVIDVNNDANEAYLHVSTLMMICAAVSIIVSLMLGFCIGQYGVAKPARALVILLQKLAGGDYDVEVQGIDRKDEIGDVAKTAVVFRKTALPRSVWNASRKRLKRRPWPNARLRRQTLPTSSKPPSAVSSRPRSQVISPSASSLRAKPASISASVNRSTHCAKTLVRLLATSSLC